MKKVVNKKIKPGYAVAVFKNEKMISEKTYGYANIKNKIKISTKTNFRLASVSKQFIAVGILLLIQNKKISLEDTLADFFQSSQKSWNEIQIFHLLTHTSGLKDYEKLIPKNTKAQLHDEDVLKILKKEKNIFKPGTKHKYNNGGYCLLRLIIEKISKQDIKTFFEKNIFKPLEMDSTTINYQGTTLIKNRALGYSLKNNKFKLTDQNTTSATIGDGGIYSSIIDMGKWSKVFYTNKILSKKMRNLMFYEHTVVNKKRKIYYGFGLFLKRENNEIIVFHGGSSIGFQTGICYLPRKRTLSVFLSNKTGERGSSKAINYINQTKYYHRDLAYRDIKETTAFISSSWCSPSSSFLYSKKSFRSMIFKFIP